ncbi:hypothetical protein OIE66_15315 [Nonomuraea sp. NBC_01738]|uniref:hypothetical protein n=1 Tax=Nonomuraea sp. NBC_01738 TaxID=2976003 RepID=UPI002E112E3A|nr:hypothetical protein OIE66_15315 [Nonomuraea sp. NBC_01738]
MKKLFLVGGVAAALVLSSGAVAAHAASMPKYKVPKIFGTTFQKDPSHDFTKGIHTRHNGILRGWITNVSGGRAEYVPIRWKPSKEIEGYFVAPKEGDATAYASPVAANVVYLSAYGCKSLAGGAMTVDRNTGLGAKKCARPVLLKRHDQTRYPSLITVYQGKIVKVQEIYTP